MAVTQVRAFAPFSGRPYGSFTRNELSAIVVEAAAVADSASAALAAAAVVVESAAVADSSIGWQPVGTVTQARGFAPFVGRRYGPFARVDPNLTAAIVESLVATDPLSGAMAAAGAVSEQAGTSDSDQGMPTGAIVESLVVTDPLSGAMAAAGAIVESTQVADAVAEAMAAAGAIVESAAATDIESGASFRMVTQARGFAPFSGMRYGSFARYTNIDGVIVESAALGDVLAAAVGYAKAIVEQVAAADAVDGVTANPDVAPQASDDTLPIAYLLDPGYSALYWDGLPVGTPPSLMGDSLVAGAESANLADLLDATVGYSKVIVESLVVTDPLSGAMAAAGTVSEQAQVPDAASGAMAAAGAISEQAGLTDFMQASQPGVYTAAITEQTQLADVLAGAMAAACTVSEQVALADAETIGVAGAVSEQVALADGAFAALAAACAASEPLGLGDAYDATIGISGAFFASIQETLDVLASVQAGVAAAASIIETVTARSAQGAQFENELAEDPRYIVIGNRAAFEVRSPAEAFNIVKEA